MTVLSDLWRTLLAAGRYTAILVGLLVGATVFNVGVVLGWRTLIDEDGRAAVAASSPGPAALSAGSAE